MPENNGEVKGTSLPISQIKIGSRHRREHGDIAALAASIADVGLIHAIAIRPDFTLVSGERRLKAIESLGWTQAPVRIIDGLEETVKALRAEASENACRLDFLRSEAGLMACHIWAPEKDAAAARKRWKRKVHSSGNFPDECTGETRDIVASVVGMTGRTLDKVLALLDAAEEDPERFGKLVEDMDRTGKVDGVYKRLQTARAAESIAREPPPLPEGPFRVIVVDPPWSYDNRSSDSSHRAANPYPSMSLDDIRGLDVKSRAHQNSVLWLWTTNAHLPHAFGIVEAWGFQYKTLLTWVKDRMGTGDWLRGQTEHCLMAIRGRPTIQLTNQTTVINGPLRGHSQKPDEFYALVEALCPGSKLEMFARAKREGWVQHGNEV